MVGCPVLHKIMMVFMGLTLDITLSRSGYVMKILCGLKTWKHVIKWERGKPYVISCIYFIIRSYISDIISLFNSNIVASWKKSY